MLRKLMTVLTCALLLGACTAAQAGFEPFVIRNGVSGAPTINTNVSGTTSSVPGTPYSGATEFVIYEGNMKAGWGSDDLNGFTLGDILSVAITRYDDTTRFDAGSGPAVAPYFNIWVTDGSGSYAVIANEPSNPAFQPLFVDNGDGSKTYDLGFSDLEDKVAKVYETTGASDGTSWVHSLFGSGPLSFADVASLTIAPPPATYIADGNGVGSGAPDELGTNDAYGFNWIFGDTLSNYVSGADGYIVGNPMAVAAAPIPLPPSALMLLTGVMGAGGFGFWRKRRAA